MSTSTTRSTLGQRTFAALGALVLSAAMFSAFAFSDDQGKIAARLAYTQVQVASAATG